MKKNTGSEEKNKKIVDYFKKTQPFFDKILTKYKVNRIVTNQYKQALTSLSADGKTNDSSQ